MVVLFAIGLSLGSLFGWWLVRRKPRSRFLLQMEYWVYLPVDAMPPQDQTMARLVESGTIGAKEALLFSDVRLHMALVLRKRNAHVFRPDLLEPHLDATPEEIATLDHSRSFVKVRYLSEKPVDSRQYLAFLPRLAWTVAELGGGTLVYDPVGSRFLDAETLRDGDPGPHVRWVAAPTGGYVETHGLKKLGLPEIRTAPIAADERWIVAEIVTQVATAAWKSGVLPPSALAEAFQDRFRVDLSFGRDNVALARVHRLQRQ